MDDDTYGEIYESDVRSLIIEYCESKGYEVEGYPFQKKIRRKQTISMTKIISVTNATLNTLIF
jgi:hypothetical protein